jgi:hypothetical protein
VILADYGKGFKNGQYLTIGKIISIAKHPTLPTGRQAQGRASRLRAETPHSGVQPWIVETSPAYRRADSLDKNALCRTFLSGLSGF